MPPSTRVSNGATAMFKNGDGAPDTYVHVRVPSPLIVCDTVPPVATRYLDGTRMDARYVNEPRGIRRFAASDRPPISGNASASERMIVNAVSIRSFTYSQPTSV